MGESILTCSSNLPPKNSGCVHWLSGCKTQDLQYLCVISLHRAANKLHESVLSCSRPGGCICELQKQLLFSSTVRSNLQIVERFSSQAKWNVLERCWVFLSIKLLKHAWAAALFVFQSHSLNVALVSSKPPQSPWNVKSALCVHKWKNCDVLEIWSSCRGSYG